MARSLLGGSLTRRRARARATSAVPSSFFSVSGRTAHGRAFLRRRGPAATRSASQPRAGQGGTAAIPASSEAAVNANLNHVRHAARSNSQQAAPGSAAVDVAAEDETTSIFRGSRVSSPSSVWRAQTQMNVLSASSPPVC